MCHRAAARDEGSHRSDSARGRALRSDMFDESCPTMGLLTTTSCTELVLYRYKVNSRNIYNQCGSVLKCAL